DVSLEQRIERIRRRRVLAQFDSRAKRLHAAHIGPGGNARQIIASGLDAHLRSTTAEVPEVEFKCERRSFRNFHGHPMVDGTGPKSGLPESRSHDSRRVRAAMA